MSYKQQFLSDQVPEWRGAYFNYNLLRELLSPFKRVTRTIPIENLTIKLIKSQNLECNISSEMQTKFCLLDEEFIQLFQDEANKCNQFFWIQRNILNYQLERALDSNDVELRKSLEILYKKGQLLKQFQKANIQAAKHILAQYSHYTSFIDNSEKHLIEYYKHLPLVTDTSLNKTVKHIKSIYQNQGWEEIELQKLKPSLTQKRDHKLFGFFGGVILFLILSFIYQRIDLSYISIMEDYSTYLLFITLGIPICYLWLFGFLLQILKKKYINYWIIFKIEYIKDSIQKLFYLASVITILYLLIVNYGLVSEMQLYAWSKHLIYYNFFEFITFDPILLLFELWVLLFIFILNPFKFFGFEARKYFWKLQFKTLSGLQIRKDVIWNCEQMVSCSQFFKLFVYSINYYIVYFSQNDPTKVKEFSNASQIVLVIPFIYRLYYSLRVYMKDKENILDVVKYTLMLLIIVLCQIDIRLSILNRAFVYIMLIMTGILISVADIKIDWNLADFNQEENKLLRPIIGYRKEFYYFAMIYNLFGRICLLFQLCTIINSRNLLLLFCLIESLRLFLWNLIAIEKEHVQNVGEFRAVPEIFIEKDYLLYIELKNLLAACNEKKSLENSFRKKATSLQLMIEQLEQKPQQI